jgi:hypothetical protein
MRLTALLPAFFLAAGASGLQAQTEYYARLGAVGASDLLHDRIINAIAVRQSIAPMIALGGSLPVGPRGYRAGLEATLASGKFHSTETGANTDLGTVRTTTLLLGLEGPMVRDLHWRLGLGGIRYWPSNHDGIFLNGGTTRFLAGAGVDYRRPALSKWDLMTSLRFDFHRFTTDALENRGFSQSQGVSRISLSIGLTRSVR